MLGSGCGATQHLRRGKKCNQTPACPKCSSAQLSSAPPPSTELLYTASRFPSYLLRHKFYSSSGKRCLKQSERHLGANSWLQPGTNPALPCCLPLMSPWQADCITGHPEKMLQNVYAGMHGMHAAPVNTHRGGFCWF